MTNLVAVELKKIGFQAKVKRNAVEVSLNRKVNHAEVRSALEQIFDDIQFSLKSDGDNVLVIV